MVNEAPRKQFTNSKTQLACSTENYREFKHSNRVIVKKATVKSEIKMDGPGTADRRWETTLPARESNPAQLS